MTEHSVAYVNAMLDRREVLCEKDLRCNGTSFIEGVENNQCVIYENYKQSLQLEQQCDLIRWSPH